MTTPTWQFNPFTCFLDKVGQGGGGGGDITLTSQNGTPSTDSAFTLQGMNALSAPSVFVSNSGSTFSIENRTWDTPYVVDQSTVPGARGTYSTLQSALDAAKADGMTFQNPKKILIRFNNTVSQWIEDLNIWSGAYFCCDAIGAPLGGAFIPPATIKGNHTLDSIGVFYSQGVNWESLTDGVPLFSGGEIITSISASDSVFSSVFADDSILDTTGNFNGYFQNCDFTGNPDTAAVFNCPSVGSLIFQTCNFNAIAMAFGGSPVYFKNCSDIGCVTMTDFPVYAYDSTFVSTKDTISCVTQNAGSFSEFYNCKFTGNGPDQYALDAPGITGYFSNCAITGISQSLAGFYSPGTVVGSGHETAGNILFGMKTDFNETLSGNESYVGVSGNIDDVEIKLRQTFADYQLWVCDEGGTASTFPITVTDVNGGLINGSTSYVINQDWGGALFRSINGTDWSVIATASSGSSDTGLTGTATSTNASVENIITVPLGPVEACYRFSFEISGRDTTTNNCVGYTVKGSAKTDGSIATIVGDPYIDSDEDTALIDADIDLIVSGNNAILQVTGVTSQTILYKATGKFTVV